jgi:hypothetical protein
MAGKKRSTSDGNTSRGVQTEIFQSDIRSDRSVTQHNDLIRAQYDMSLLEMRLFIALLARINRGDKEFTPFKIPVNELFYIEERAGEEKSDKSNKVGGKTYTQIKRAVIRLSSRTFTIESKDENGNREVVSNPLMATCRYKEKSGYVIAQFNNFVKPYLLELTGGFTTAQELTLLGFRSFYSFRVYWLLKLNAFNRDIIQVGVDEIKHMFNLTGKYANYADFKRFVLDVAQQEIAPTDMAFEFEPVKEGRSVAAIMFKLLRPNLIALIGKNLPDTIHQRLTELGLSITSLHEIKWRYQQGRLSDEYVQFVLMYYDQLQHKARIRSLPGAIYKAIVYGQLANEFELWKQNHVYRAPTQKPTTQVTEDVISLGDLRSGWEAMKKQGLSDYETFEESLQQYRNHPDYRFEMRGSEECLIYSRREG